MDTLTVGSPAPEVKGVKWLNTDPIERLEPGHVYVVEFWATWCGPCRAGMPHLSQLSAKLAGRATVIGVNVFEQDQGSEQCCQTVAAFVEKMGPKLTYPVLVDGPDQYMAEQWMRRSGRQGIPSAFIVDQKGTVVWIGHPQQGLDQAVDAVLEGRTPEATQSNGMAADLKKRMELMAPLLELLQKGDYDAAVREIDRLVALDASFGGAAGQLRIQAAAMCGRDDLVRPYLEQMWCSDTEPYGWQALAHLLSVSPNLSRESYELGIRIVQRGIASAGGEEKYLGIQLDGLAKLYRLYGDRERAIETARAAVAECDKWPDSGARYKAHCEMTLQQLEEEG